MVPIACSGTSTMIAAQCVNGGRIRHWRVLDSQATVKLESSLAVGLRGGWPFHPNPITSTSEAVTMAEAGQVERGAMFDEFVVSGLIDDADVTIETARFVSWDYKGQVTPPVLALQLWLVDADGNKHDDYLSAGDQKFFVPSSDGRKAIPVGSQQKLNINTNAVEFIISLMNADTRGQLAAKIKGGDDIGVIDGVKVHVVRKAQKKRAGIQIQANAPDPNQPGQAPRQKTVLTVEKVIAYPWEAAGAAPATAQAPTAGTVAAPAAAGGMVAGVAADLQATTVGTLLQIVAESGGSIKKSQIAGKVFSNPDVKAMPTPVRNSLLGLIVRADFLASEAVASMGIKYDAASDTVALGG